MNSFLDTESVALLKAIIAKNVPDNFLNPPYWIRHVNSAFSSYHKKKEK